MVDTNYTQFKEKSSCNQGGHLSKNPGIIIYNLKFKQNIS